jgi:exopolysaccharide biosynthesis WecB/TagA/CpsF family protein
MVMIADRSKARREGAEGAVTWEDDSSSHETRMAIRNTLQLGSSLLFTWSIALAMRFWLPRRIGPGLFGTLSFADAFATTFFIALNLGLDAYVLKEVAVRSAHASDFFGGMLAIRASMWMLLAAIMTVTMTAMGRPPEVQRVVYVFAVAQLFVATNSTLSAFLQAKGNVGSSSVLAIATKIIWALGAVLAIVAGVGLWGVALAYLVSEAVESVVLFRLASRHLGLVLRLDVAATRTVVIVSLPIYLNILTTTAYGRLDVTLLTLAGDSDEVGWYAAASAIASLSLLLTPLIGSVLMPTLARAAARSREELFSRIRSATELILVLAVPAALFIDLGADLGVRLLFGDAFAPAGLALRILAPTFVVTYVGIVLATTLLMLNRTWTLVLISASGLAVNVALNLTLVRPALARLGAGGGGAGCAVAKLGTELFVTAIMVWVVGRRAFDRRIAVAVGKSLVACAIVVGVDRLGAPVKWARLVIYAIVYVTFVMITGAVRPEWLTIALAAARRRRAPPGEPCCPGSGRGARFDVAGLPDMPPRRRARSAGETGQNGDMLEWSVPVAGVMPRRSFHVGHARVDDLTLSEALDAIARLVQARRGGTVFTPNVDHVVRLERDALLLRAYASVSLSLPDGMPILWASRLLGSPVREKVSGSDLILPLMKLAAERRYRVYFLGGGDGVAARAAERLVREIPGLVIVGTDARRLDVDSSPQDQDDLVAALAAATPNLILLALGCPKQEILAHRIADRVRPAVCIGVGAGLDFVAGTKPRAPRWMSNIGLEWLHRLVHEPRRLWRRYLVEDPKFCLILLRDLRTRHRR